MWSCLLVDQHRAVSPFTRSPKRGNGLCVEWGCEGWVVNERAAGSIHRPSRPGSCDTAMRKAIEAPACSSSLLRFG